MAPRITVIHINKDKIREVIGPGGKVIREICEVTGARVDLEDDGTVKVAAVDQSAADAAIDWIRSIAAEPEVGTIYTGKVVKIVDFGAFVNFLGNRDGLVHISELSPRARRQGQRRRSGRRSGQGQADRHRRSRQDQAVDARRRSGDRRGHLDQGHRQSRLRRLLQGGRRHAGGWSAARFRPRGRNRASDRLLARGGSPAAYRLRNLRAGQIFGDGSRLFPISLYISLSR